MPAKYINKYIDIANSLDIEFSALRILRNAYCES